MKKVTKAIIPCGGMGTRFLPITKAVPKEILPVIDTPVLAHIVDEVIKSGATDVLIILGKGKEMIREYFSPNKTLENALKDKPEMLKLVTDTYKKGNISFEYQLSPKGSGDAVLHAEKFVGKDPFMLCWGDDLIYNEQEPVCAQLAKAYEKYGTSILGVQKCETDDIVKYGVASISSSEGRAHRCKGIIEKPSLDQLPSRLTSLGRYIITADVFDVIRKTPIGKNGELQLTDSLNLMCATSGVYAYEFEGRRYDMGDKKGSLEAIVEYGLRNQSFGDDFRKYLKELAKTL